MSCTHIYSASKVFTLPAICCEILSRTGSLLRPGREVMLQFDCGLVCYFLLTSRPNWPYSKKCHNRWAKKKYHPQKAPRIDPHRMIDNPAVGPQVIAGEG